MSPFFDDLERQLMAVHARSRGETPWRARPLRVLAYAAVAIAAVALLSSFVRFQDAPEIEATAPRTSASPALVKDFPIFAEPVGPEDSLGSRTRGASIDPATTHAIGPRSPASGPGRAVTSRFFVALGPGRSVCVLVLPADADGPGSACASRAQALAGRAYLTIEQGGGWEIGGLAPPGSRVARLKGRSGEITRAPVDAGTFSAWLPERAAGISFAG